MKGWAVCIGIAIGWVGVTGVRGEAGETSLADRAREWVRDLGSSEYEVRREAVQRLKEAGTGVLPYIEEGMELPDAEVSRQCRRIAEWIRERGKRERLHETFEGIGLLIDFFPQVTDESYFDGTKEEKKRLCMRMVFDQARRHVLQFDHERLQTLKTDLMFWYICNEPDPEVVRSALGTVLASRDAGWKGLESTTVPWLTGLWEACARFPTGSAEKRGVLSFLIRFDSGENRNALAKAIEAKGAADPALQWGAGHLEVKEAGPGLVRQLEKKPTEFLIWALIRIGEEKAVEPLARLLADRTPLPRSSGAILPKEIREKIDPARVGGVPVCDRALEALIRITGKDLHTFFPGGVPEDPPPSDGIGGSKTTWNTIRAGTAYRMTRRGIPLGDRRKEARDPKIGETKRRGGNRSDPPVLYRIDFRFGALSDPVRTKAIRIWREQ